ncbi:type VII secretion target [Mycolicibacterium sp. ND9-15]|uniref:type VII secretion target n=1 Tax=Mycolicibacterium sp. ND9-15 TaxID=3042320 RepID=UPI002DDB2116|nr:type VII secretion target [Mycolicibacterium sp. ND9-15]WSE58256.1 type VII secretion target [Mycolicibacterium sp. ND9-15]
MTETLRIDTGLVREAGARLQALAGAIPPPPASHSPAGGDALSTAIAAKVAEVVDPVIAQLPVTKDELTRYAEKVVNAANTYDAVDRQIAEEILKRDEALDDAAGPGGGATAGFAGSSSGATASPVAGEARQAGQMGSMTQIPAQMTQQATQAPMQAAGMAAAIPQAMTQGAQQAVQQVGPLAETAGKAEEPGRSGESVPQEQTAAGDTNGERAPETSSSPGSARSTEEGPGIAL